MDKSDIQNADVQAAPEKSSLKDMSLKAAGYSYLVGDAALFTAAILEKNYRNAATGVLWGLGGLAAARYGNPKPEKQLEILERKLGQYLKSQNIILPNDPTTASMNNDGGVIQKIEDFLYEHPSEALNAIYGLGSATLIAGGLKGGINPKTGKKGMFFADTASGVLVAAGALSGLLIKEKKPDPNHPPHGVLEQTFAWAQEQPLRVSGYFYGANNVFTLLGAYQKQHSIPETKSYLFRYATVASYVFANAMTSISSKNNDTSKHPEITTKLAEVSARVIAAQPAEAQEVLLQNIAGYLAAQPGMHQTAAELADLLHNTLKAVAPASPQANAISERSWEGKVAQTSLTVAPSL